MQSIQLIPRWCLGDLWAFRASTREAAWWCGELSAAPSFSLPTPSAPTRAREMMFELTHSRAYSWRKSPLTFPAALTCDQRAQGSPHRPPLPPRLSAPCSSIAFGAGKVEAQRLVSVMECSHLKAEYAWY